MVITPTIHMEFAKVPLNQDFRPLPFGTYPAWLMVDAFQTDNSGALATDSKGQPVFRKTKKGDPWWKLEFEIVAGSFKGRKILDNLFFSEGGKKRVAIMYIRAGLAEQNSELDVSPTDLVGYWYIDIDRHEVAMQRDGKTPYQAKRPFRRRDCICDVCRANDGKEVNINSKIAFDGFKPIPAVEAKKYTHGVVAVGPTVPATEANGVCASCLKGEHHHKFEEGDCFCQEESHLSW